MLATELPTIITFNPWSISPGMTLEELVSMLCAVEFNHWPVVDDERRLVGVLSNVDLLRTVNARLEAALTFGKATDAMEAIQNCCVSEIMSHRVATITPDAQPSEALRLLVENQIKSLPVSEEDRLVGVITRTDVLREFSSCSSKASRYTASEAMERCEYGVDCDATLEEAGETTQLAQADYLSVMRGDLPLGIVSIDDLRMAKLRQTIQEIFADELAMPGETTILELARTAPTIRPGERLGTVAATMVEHRRTAIGVVNQAGRLLGVVDDGTLFRFMFEALDS